jgi:hypothetical protein
VADALNARTVNLVSVHFLTALQGIAFFAGSIQPQFSAAAAVVLPT